MSNLLRNSWRRRYGSGIAQVFAMNGNYSIYLCDLTEELAEKGKKSIDKTLA